MNLTEFLTLLVPSGVLVAGKLEPRVNPKGKPFNAFSHAIAKVHSDFAGTLIAMDGESRNTYFALASYKQGFHPSPKDPAKKQLRVRTNVASLKALWFDIDFKGSYPDIKTAVLALKVFSQATQIPTPPLLVGSGNGLHAYWPFDIPIELERWQRLADALKTAALDQKLEIDPVCTADACRVLRPINTFNWKDPEHPKPVVLLLHKPRTFTYEELETALTPWLGAKRPGNGMDYSELTGGLAPPKAATASFDTIVKQCGVAKMLADTHGKEATEPLWVASLQLLRHCQDGEMWVHPLSDGHPGYDADQTRKKWEARSLDHGPTLCSTFEMHEPTICAKCPHRGFIKSPVQLEGDDEFGPLPRGWRIAANQQGVEHEYFIEETKTKEWKLALRFIPSDLRATYNVMAQELTLMFGLQMGNSPVHPVILPCRALGNDNQLSGEMSGFGFPFKKGKGKAEINAFHSLMTTWVDQLRSARRIASVTNRLGWVIDPNTQKPTGFSCGATTYYADGLNRNDVRPTDEYSSIAKLYEPSGDFEQWKKVADFLADQNQPAFTVTLAAAFAAPLLRFTGVSGAILSVVSTASGVGKSSALKCSQAVWGSPTHGVSAVNDTPNSVAHKLGFLNNLPTYWDELRGKSIVDAFLTLAFQISQGKERTRLDSSARLKEVSTWETLLIVASNASIFEAMNHRNQGSDAGAMRTFEITVDPLNTTERERAELMVLFNKLNLNYGHAGQVYSKYLAENTASVVLRVESMLKQLCTAGKMQPQERFWFAVVTSLVVGAQIAAELDLVKLNVRDMLRFLLKNIEQLRTRTEEAMEMSAPNELVAAFIAEHQDCALVVESFPNSKTNLAHYEAKVISGPRSKKLIYEIAKQENRLRVSVIAITDWLQRRELPVTNTIANLGKATPVRRIRVKLGFATPWRLSAAQQCLEIDLTGINLDASLAIPPDLDGPAPAVPVVPAV